MARGVAHVITQLLGAGWEMGSGAQCRAEAAQELSRRSGGSTKHITAPVQLTARGCFSGGGWRLQQDLHTRANIS